MDKSRPIKRTIDDKRRIWQQIINQNPIFASSLVLKGGIAFVQAMVSWHGLQKVNILIVMIDRALGLGPVQQQSYYFQLIPIFLSIVGKESEMPAEGTTYKFSVSKGQQKFDQNKFPLQANFSLIDGVPFMSVASCKLNFYIPSFNRLRKQEFTLRLIQNQRNQDYDVGEYSIDISQLVEAFKQEKKVRHELKTFFSEDYELDFEIYVEKTRMALEKTIKEFQADRSGKSPSKVRLNTSEVQSPTKPAESDKPERDQEPSSSKKQPIQEPKTAIVIQEQSRVVSEKIIETVEPQRKKTKQNFQEEEGSIKMDNQVPLIQTKFKQLAKQDTPSEIKLKESQRLSRIESQTQIDGVPKDGDSKKEKLIMWIFLLAGVVVMYFAMHPNRRV